MDNSVIQAIENGKEENVVKILTDFNEKNSQVFTFPTITNPVKNKFSQLVVKLLSPSSQRSCWSPCLKCIRIIGRDKDGVNELASPELLDTILYVAGLKYESLKDGNLSHSLILDAQQTLFNLLFNSIQVQGLCSSNGCIEGILNRLKTYKDSDLPSEVKFYDMRILFLLTVFCTKTRLKLHDELDGLVYLTDVLSLIVNGESDETDIILDADQVKLTNEILKVLFNITLGTNNRKLNEEEEAHYMTLVSTLQDLILVNTNESDKKKELISNIINLLPNLPPMSFEELMSPVLNTASNGGDAEYEGKNVQSILEILKYFENQLHAAENSANLKEVIAPVLACLCVCCKGNKIIRKYVRSKVLPPLRSVHQRPEEGTTIRNRLCRMMTSPNINLKNLSAEFLFILCKYNVKRFVKYSGYGNAAGLLASYGLMLGNRGTTTEFSSESEDSETEEYASQMDQINPVTGCCEVPKLDPLAEMSDEQKEYEAIKLVNMMDKLAREQIIQPTKIGADGKPHPVEHILELCESENIEGSTQSKNEGD